MPVVTRDIFGRRTSDPAYVEFLPQARTHMASFNGTWAGDIASSRKTLVPQLANVFHDRENVFETPVDGVGTHGSWEDWIKGGIGGWGTTRNVCIAYKNIARRYRPGDRIILSGYSRGAWAARYLAKLINTIGLPKDGDEDLFRRIYEACSKKNSIFKPGVADELLEGYECWTNVEIDALCCFDTVGSLGLPLTGLAKPLTLLRGWKKKHEIIGDVAPNVRFAFHALSIDELREPYYPTLMRGRNVYQVSFPGTHSNLGWMEPKEGLVHGPLAWMIQQLSTFLNITFDEDKLKKCFPSYYAEGSVEPTAPKWYKGDIKRHSSFTLHIMGKKARQPGRINGPNRTTEMKIHVGARLRAEADRTAVPDYSLVTPRTGRPYWALSPKTPSWMSFRTNSSESSSSSSSEPKGRFSLCFRSPSMSKTADMIEEAAVGPLEARLLGLPQSFVTPQAEL